MFKFIKLIINLAILVLIVGGGFYFYFNYIDVAPNLSDVQNEIINTVGRPEQFIISYLPQEGEEGEQLIRQEVWFYPSQERKLIFLGGQLVATENLEVKEGVVYSSTVLKSEDFDFYTTLEEVENFVGKLNLAQLELPVFFDTKENGLKTYVSKQAMFIFEQGYLSYIETLD